MEWEPIETYDKLKRKPQYAVFRFAPKTAPLGRIGLAEYIGTERRYGNRVCTHWFKLPDPPQEAD